MRIRGLVDGGEVDCEQRVRSVARTFSTATDWPEICRIMCEEVQIVLSNTGDAGYRPAAVDGAETFQQDMSYPAKLMHLLLVRFKRNPSPVQVMPLELITDNGDVAPKAVIKGPLSELIHPGGIALNVKDGEIYASDSVRNAVYTFLVPELFSSKGR